MTVYLGLVINQSGINQLSVLIAPTVTGLQLLSLFGYAFQAFPGYGFQIVPGLFESNDGRGELALGRDQVSLGVFQTDE